MKRWASLGRLRLEGRALIAHRALQSSAGLFALVGLATLFFPLHEVRDSGFGQALGCAFMVDCHVTPRPPRTEAEILATAPDAVHDGLDHGGPPALALFLILAAGEIASLARPRFWVGMGTACAGVLLGGFALLITLVDLSHMFDHVHVLRAGRIHEGAVIGLALAAVTDLVAQPILYVRARWLEASRRAELPVARAE